ncbi:hypothetical protein JW998_09095, partial [candidate division KSB1 bacterium]|nr:hypothetical protein [candidate division KSB1 bacterium]
MRRLTALLLSHFIVVTLSAQSLDIPTKHYGLSIGNSSRFTGLRINFSDKDLQEINGVNITFWKARSSKTGVINGLAIGLV